MVVTESLRVSASQVLLNETLCSSKLMHVFTFLTDNQVSEICINLEGRGEISLSELNSTPRKMEEKDSSQHTHEYSLATK